MGRSKCVSFFCIKGWITCENFMIRWKCYWCSEFLFIGNDVNDIPALKIVGCPIGVADSYPEIDEFILFRTKTKGGCGAVREICDLILKVQILI